MNIKEKIRNFSKSLYNIRRIRKIGDKMPIHNIHMNPVCPCVLDSF